MRIAIIVPDTLVALGLKHLLSSFFQTDAVIYKSIQELRDFQTESFDGYFVSAEAYITCSDLFLPRKSQVVIIGNNFTFKGDDILYLDTHSIEEEIIESIDSCLQVISDKKVSKRCEELSPREIDVLRCIARGLLNKETADELHISINTVLTHRKNIISKLGIKTVSGLSLYAIMNGIIAPKDQQQ